MINYIKDDINEVMEITGLNYQKAEKLFQSVAKDLDDGSDPELCSYDVIDVIRIEQNSKACGNRHYEKSQTLKSERKPRERKIDTDKAKLLNYIKQGLTLGLDSTLIQTENEVKLHFPYNGSEYSVTLTKHRAPKF